MKKQVLEDIMLCKSLKHEFLRCEDAFKVFEMYAIKMILNGESPIISYKTYNAYSYFLHHLYEFLKGAIFREIKLGMTKGKIITKDSKTVVIEKIKQIQEINGEVADRFIKANAQRVLDGILNYATLLEKDTSCYREKVPEEFAKEFRQIRNHIIAHVSLKRTSLNLSEFYQKYHQFVYMMYFNCLGHWGHAAVGIPDLNKITDFSVIVENNMLKNRI